MSDSYSILFQPTMLGKLELKNRLVLSPMGCLIDTDGKVSERYISMLEERAKGGAGMIIPEAFMTVPNPGYFQHNIYNDSCIPSLSLLTERIHSHGAKICCQMGPGEGRIGKIIPGEPIPVAPSAIPAHADPSVICRPLTIEEIHEREDAYFTCGKRVIAAGFDAVEVHAHAGYLIDQFMSSEWNHRTDEYGGSLENRMRFPVNIIKNLRKAVGPDVPILYRMAGDHKRKNGRTIEETIQIVKILMDAGIDALDINAGCYGESFYWMFPPSYLGDACMLDIARTVKQATGITILNSGNHTPETAAAAVSAGDADFIMMGRPLLADPDLPNKLRSGHREQIRPCLRCNERCVNEGLFKVKSISCAVNPRVGHEKDYVITKAETPKNIAIIGSGPAGLEAARVSALRGHTVTVYEKEGQIGGNAAVASTPEFKTIKGLLAWYQLQMEDLGVKVVLNKEITPDSPELAEADQIFAALGAHSWAPSIQGLDSDIRVDICDAHLHPELVKGEQIVICGGGLSGTDYALEIAGQGKHPVIIEMLPRIAGDTCFVNQVVIHEKIQAYQIDVKTGYRVKELTDHSVIAEDADGNALEIPADTIVTAFGLRGNRPLAVQIRERYPDTILLGDCDKVSTIASAIKDGFLRAMTLA
ncbi:MAG: NAD(P)/FAD-dependent oxidoreductase [Eubacteriales bacterium]|nr:NAD(P)/FAD-dependent oxidoreductase [Eubacteriales bacterium]